MACYAALASVVELLEDVLSRNRYPNLRLGRLQSSSLHDKFWNLLQLLQDYSSKGDEATDRMERQITNVAYKAQDIIESEISKQTRPRNVIKRAFDRYRRNLAGLNLEQKIDSIVRELKAIKKRHRNESLQLNYGSSAVGASEQTPNGRNTMVGFDSYLLSIKEQLCGSSSQFQVIPIVGIGGIGKTTLARNIFDDSLIVYYFDCRGWVTVSQDYDVNIVLCGLLKSMGLKVDESNGEEESVLKERIYKHFKGKRYLVIIDDIWSREVWDDLRHILPDDCNGSRIVLTTRLLDLVQYTSNCGLVHEIQFLNEKDSWNLFQERVFAQDCCPPELENIGKSIARKCYGLPLAIVAIAGMLSNVRLQQEWEEIATNMGNILSEADNCLSKVLSLSYNHLPHQLKTCFLYMGIFPEDYEISVSNLIWLWIAEGFLNYKDESKSLEEVGEECLEDLVKRNLILITKKKSNGQFKSCILHDLVRDFCRHKAFHQEFFVINNTNAHLNPKSVENARYFNVHYGVQICPLTPSKVARSFLWFCKLHSLPPSFHKIEWGRYESLRVWGTCDVNSKKTDSIPDAFSQMFRLKYLCYHGNIFLQDIHPPPSLSILRNLQTLIIHAKFSSASIALPPEIWKMTQLRHVMINKLVLPPLHTVGYSLPGGLYRLQTLMTVLNFTFTNEVMEMIPNLQKLKIHYWESEYNDGTGWLPSLENLIHLIHLTRLEELVIRYDTVFLQPVDYNPFPSFLAFPLCLRKLSLRGCRAPWKDLTIVGSLPNLQVLRLRYNSFVGEEWEPIEGEFSCLKFLLLESLDLKYWRAEENSHFPRLEHLKIRECKELKSIPIEFGDIPTLKFIDVYESELVEDSAIQIREDQENLGNDMLQVRLGYR